MQISVAVFFSDTTWDCRIKERTYAENVREEAAEEDMSAQEGVTGDRIKLHD
jgi:hypothetical protein